MTETASKLPVSIEKSKPQRPASLGAWRPLEALHREVDRLFEDFQRDFWPSTFSRPFLAMRPLLQRDMSWGSEPAIDIIDGDKAYEVTADLPGMDEKSVDVKLANGCLLIKGEKQEDKEETKKDFYLQERRFNSFERRIRLPDGVDADKVAATFKNGVLTVTLPKTPEAQKAEKKIAVKVAA